ncbi:RING-H2 finger protein ATL7 isoform X1 [Ricinus communis]|uniref:RING-H2 finger protein ATL7 isoform X1 n=1 Tax=Ricinus communis TaxID=3988 RepID=UPI00201AFE88|nr:RING-H2 finger protein ATL7 isoform X1 [Ricinus communis]
MSRFKSQPPSCCSEPSSSSSVASTELKLYQAFIFSVPIFFTFVLLFLFYLFYLRRRRVDWASLRMRANLQGSDNIFRQAELGLKKEVREMLPIIVYKESFSVKDTQCPVCLGDYQAEDRLQQIPACGHTFHMVCIDHWLANHTTCPLCRLSLVAPAKVPTESPNNQVEAGQESFVAVSGGETSAQSGSGPGSCGESNSRGLSEPRNEDSGTAHSSAEEEERRSQSADQGKEVRDEKKESEERENIREVSRS